MIMKIHKNSEAFESAMEVMKSWEMHELLDGISRTCCGTPEEKRELIERVRFSMFLKAYEQAKKVE